jgi:hypothetical protein
LKNIRGLREFLAKNLRWFCDTLSANNFILTIEMKNK